MLSPEALKQPAGNGESISAASLTDQEKLSKFYQTALEDLKVLQRSALMNRIYEGEKLVVEKPRLIVGGGGAGQEAAVGGGGQPISGPQSSGGAPPSS